MSISLTNINERHAHGFDGERAMKMTSKGTLLVALAGVIGLGCSSPADDDGGMKDPPLGNPPFVGQPQTPSSNQQQTTTNPLQPTPMTETPPPTQQVPQQQTPAAGSGGSSGMPPATGSMIPTGAPGTGFTLTPVAGWVAGATNEAGIQGSFFTLSDSTGTPPGVTTITPKDFTMVTGGDICVSGTASQVMNMAYSQYWGGGVGFNLADPGGNMGPQPWTRGKVVGFSFTVTGTTIPPMGQFRFGVDFYSGATVNHDACVNIVSGANTIRFDQVVDACYTPPGGAPVPATAQLQALKWQVATATTAATPFNFCITNLKAITQ